MESCPYGADVCPKVKQVDDKVVGLGDKIDNLVLTVIASNIAVIVCILGAMLI